MQRLVHRHFVEIGSKKGHHVARRRVHLASPWPTIIAGLLAGLANRLAIVRIALLTRGEVVRADRHCLAAASSRSCPAAVALAGRSTRRLAWRSGARARVAVRQSPHGYRDAADREPYPPSRR